MIHGARAAAAAIAVLLAVAPRAGAQERAGAPVDVKAFRYERTIPAGDSGLVAVMLDAAVLAHSSRADLRIADAAGRQVPYLLDRLNNSLVVPLPVPRPIAGRSAEASIGGTAAPQRSRYWLDLPFARLPDATLVLETSERVFDRRVTVAVQDPPAASDQPRRASGERVIASAAWRHTDPDSAAGPLRLALPPLPVSALVLIVDEGDNRPLPLGAPTLQLPAYRLRFFRDSGTVLTLVYGQPGLSAPRYDLALAASRLAASAVRTAVLGPEREVPHVARHTPLVVFWCALVIAITLLLVLLARLLRQGASPAAAAPADARAAPPSSTE